MGSVPDAFTVGLMDAMLGQLVGLDAFCGPDKAHVVSIADQSAVVRPPRTDNEAPRRTVGGIARAPGRTVVLLALIVRH
jgi:hypothetical protein